MSAMVVLGSEVAFETQFLEPKRRQKVCLKMLFSRSGFLLRRYNYDEKIIVIGQKNLLVPEFFVAKSDAQFFLLNTYLKYYCMSVLIEHLSQT